MDLATKILVYADISTFGGHELMGVAASKAIRHCYPEVEISWLISSDNDRLIQELKQNGLHFSFLKSTPRERLLKHPFAVLRAIIENACRIREMSPDVVMVSQGIVTFSFIGSLAARWAGVAHCCYLPMGALASECDEKGASRLLDWLWRLCFRLTPNYITIDEEQKRLILSNNPRARVRIVENHVPSFNRLISAQSDARRMLGIPGTRPVIGVVGRVRFAQKNQDWLVRQLACDSFWKNYLFLIVGDGPDLPELNRMIQELKLEDQVHVIGWSETVQALYQALNLLLIPSRAEGVPLVMLEALANGIPVAGSNRDGMKLWLPESWRFEVGDGEGMKRAVLAAMQDENEEFWHATDRHLDHIQNTERFATEFFEAIVAFGQSG